MTHKPIVRRIACIALTIYPLSGFAIASHYSGLENTPEDLKQFGSFDSYKPQSNWKVFDEMNNTKQINDLRRIDYNSSIQHKGAEWSTQFDANNHYTPDEEDNYKLEINRFYLSYKNKDTGINSRVGRQASANVAIVGPMDGITLQAPLVSQISIGASVGFPVSSFEKDEIQSNKPFFVFNAKLPKLYKSLVLKPYVAMQQLDGFLNRQSIGTELHFRKNKSNIYQLMDYNIQFNALNRWLIQGRMQKSNTTSYHMSLDYRRNPDLTLHNALLNEYRASDLTGLSTILSNDAIIAQAKDRTAKNFSATLGSSFPLSSRLQVGADIKRRDQVYQAPDENNDSTEHNYQNEVSTQLIASNLLAKKLIRKSDTLSVEFEYVSAKYFTNTALSVRDEIQLSGLYQLDLEFRLTEGENDNGELLLSTLPTATLSCQCSKKLSSEFEIGYENWNYSGNTQQIDESRVYASVNFRLEL